MEKIKVLDTINIDTNMFMTSFEKACKLLIEQKEILEKKGWSDIRLKFELSYDGGELLVCGMRYETDGEYNKRVKLEEKKLRAKELKLERERKKYEELKEKFEN